VNEADTRATLIEPKLRLAGWTDRLVTREYYYQRDHQFAPGRIILIGDQVRRGISRRIDYLLRMTEGLPIAVVEAKADTEPVEAGLEQAKRYAQELGLTFAYATDGRHIIEYDFSIHASRSLPNFPSPQELWARWSRTLQGATTAEGLKAAETPPNYGQPTSVSRDHPLLHPYCPMSLCGKSPFYFQEVAIREVIGRLWRGQRRVLMAMATGTGKTFVAFQIIWKLLKSGWLKRHHPDRPARVLFLADRVVLRDQAYNTFFPFADGTSDPRHLIESHPPNLNRDLYFGIYQTLWSPIAVFTRMYGACDWEAPAHQGKLRWRPYICSGAALMSMESACSKASRRLFSTW
jgi:type I restriction enzyme, R subunit